MQEEKSELEKAAEPVESEKGKTRSVIGEMMTAEALHDLADIEALIKDRGYDLRGWSADCEIGTCAQRDEVITLKFARQYYVPLS